MASRLLFSMPAGLIILLFLSGISIGLKANNPDLTTMPDSSQAAYHQPSIKQGLGCWIGFSAINIAESAVQECYIIINPEATEGYDYQYDAAFVPGAGPVFYNESEGVRLSTNSIPELSPQTLIRFIFCANSSGLHRLEVFGLELIQEQVFLYDQLAKSDQNLSLNPVYEFNAEVGEDSSRFMLHFQPQSTGHLSGQSPRMFVSSGNFVIRNAESAGLLSFFTPGGLCIKEYPVLAAGDVQIPLNLSPGIYIIKFRYQHGTLVQKIFVP